jgi:hypothetical protein
MFSGATTTSGIPLICPFKIAIRPLAAISYEPETTAATAALPLVV